MGKYSFKIKFHRFRLFHIIEHCYCNKNECRKDGIFSDNRISSFHYPIHNYKGYFLYAKSDYAPI